MAQASEAERFDLSSRRIAMTTELDHYQQLTNVLDQSIAYQNRLLESTLQSMRVDLSTCGEQMCVAQRDILKPWSWQDVTAEHQMIELTVAKNQPRR